MCELRSSHGPIPLPPKAYSVLLFLVENADRMVSKAELMDAFWPPNATEASLQTTLSIIRKALREAGARDSILKTVHGQGVRVLTDVRIKDDHTLPPSIQDQSPALEEQRSVAVLCLRIKATADTGSDQQCIAETLQMISPISEKLIASHQGQLLHMMIDGFTAVFGLGAVQDDAVRNSTAAAFELLAKGHVGGQTQLSVGLACGPVPIGDTTSDNVWAPPSDIERDASQLAAKAGPFEVIATEPVISHLKDEVVTVSAPEGLRILSAPFQRAGVPAPTNARFVGRNAELAFLNASAQALEGGAGQAVMLSGPAGIGKSRLIREFLSTLDTSQTAMITLNCLPRLSNTALAPIGDLVSKLAPPADLNDAVDTALLKRFLGEPASEVLAGLSGVALQQRSCEVLKNLVSKACKARPLVLVFEDVHWMDGSSITHLEALIELTNFAPLLVLLSSRPTEDPDLTDAALHLPPLGLSDSLSLLQGMPMIAGLSGSEVRALAERASGNPFFLEELALSHLDGSQSIPSTVLAVIENRVSLLSTRLRQMLYCVVTIGPPAPIDLVAHLLEASEESVRPELDELIRLGFLREEADGFFCRHMLVSDAAYAMIAPAERKRLHREIAAYLEQSPEIIQHRPELLALHQQEAGALVPAVQNWTRASNAALSRAAAEEAIAFAKNGLALLKGPGSENPALEMGLHLSMAPALMATRGYGAPEAGKAFRQAFDLNAKLGVSKVQPRILLGLWLHSWVAGDLKDSVAHARKLELIANEIGHPGLIMQACAGIGAVLTHLGEFRAARSKLLTGLRHLDAQGPDSITTQNLAVTCASYAAWTAALLGEQAAVEEHVQQSKRLSKALENPFAEAIHFGLCCDAYLIAGDAARCEEFAARASTLSKTHNYPFWLGTGLVMQGAANAQQGEPDKGLKTIERGIAVFEATGAGVQLANWYGLKAEAHLAAEQPEHARSSAQLALDHMKRTGDVWFAENVHAALAAAYAALGDAEAAELHARLATEQAVAHRRAEN